MRPTLPRLGLFVALLLAALLIQWPAAWLATRIEQASGGQWRLVAVDGSVWRGAGMLLVREPGGNAWRNVQSLRWRLLPTSLTSGRAEIELTLDQGSLRLAATPGGFAADAIDATLPAEAIAAALPGALGRYRWSGLLHLQSRHFACDWQASRCSGEAALQWREAAVAEVPGPPLGDYRLRLIGEGPALRVNLDTLQGRLRLAGQGEIAAGGRVRFAGEASAEAGDGKLDSLLNTLGRPAGGGRYRLDYRETGGER